MYIKRTLLFLGALSIVALVGCNNKRQDLPNATPVQTTVSATPNTYPSDTTSIDNDIDELDKVFAELEEQAVETSELDQIK
jgi:hypothetical protein